MSTPAGSASADRAASPAAAASLSSEVEPAESPPPSGRRSRRTVVLAACAAGIAVAGGLIGGAVVSLTQGSTAMSRLGPEGAACVATSVADSVLPSVVTPVVQASEGQSNGSGEVIRDGGYILTNDHVISPAVTGGQVSAVFDSGDSQPATIVGRAPALDLAVVRVADQGKHPVLPPAAPRACGSASRSLPLGDR